MALREIVLLPDPVLRKKAKKVKTVDKDIVALIDDMVDTMRDAPGVGLAAPQVGESLQIVVIEFGDEEDETVEPKLYVLVNPEFVKKSSETVNGIEACLSVPGLVGTVDRSEEITVKALNRNGQPYRINAKGWLARIFQHEIDHLDGVVYTDLANKVWVPQESVQYDDV